MTVITRWDPTIPPSQLWSFSIIIVVLQTQLRAAHEVLEENNDVRLVFKEYPILGEASYLASSAALAINDKLKYLTYHSKLMTHQGRISESVIEKTLSDMKLSPQKLRSEARSDKHFAIVRNATIGWRLANGPGFCD